MNTEMKSNTLTESHCYTATIYLNDGEKFPLDYYTLEGIKELKKDIDAAGESYAIYLAEANVYGNETLNEVRL